MDARLATLDRLFDAFNRHDAEGVMACFAHDAAFFPAAGPSAAGRRITGHEAIRAAFAAVWDAMPDVRWGVHHRAVYDDSGVAAWLLTGTPATGPRVEVEGVDLFTFAGDRVASKSAFRKDRTPA